MGLDVSRLLPVLAPVGAPCRATFFATRVWPSFVCFFFGVITQWEGGMGPHMGVLLLVLAPVEAPYFATFSQKGHGPLAYGLLDPIGTGRFF